MFNATQAIALFIGFNPPTNYFEHEACRAGEDILRQSYGKNSEILRDKCVVKLIENSNEFNYNSVSCISKNYKKICKGYKVNIENVDSSGYDKVEFDPELTEMFNKMTDSGGTKWAQ